MRIKNTVFDALKEGNMKHQSRVEQLEEKHGNIKNNHDQYTRLNNIEIQVIPATVADDHLENKLIAIFRCLKINIDLSDIKDCQGLGNSAPKNIIVRLINRKFCKEV